MTTTPKYLVDAPEMPEPVGKVELMGSFRGQEAWGCLLTVEGQAAATYGEGLFTETQQEARDQQWQKIVNAKQAQIDHLMLEYCPNEMNKEQFDNWAAHQKVVKP